MGLWVVMDGGGRKDVGNGVIDVKGGLECCHGGYICFGEEMGLDSMVGYHG